MILAKYDWLWSFNECKCFGWLWPLMLIPALLGLWWAWNLWGAWGKRLGLLKAEGERLTGGINSLKEKVGVLTTEEQERKRLLATQNLEATAAVDVRQETGRVQVQADSVETKGSGLGIAAGAAALGAAGIAGAGALRGDGDAGDAEIAEEPEPDRPSDVSGYSSYLGQYDGEDVRAEVPSGVIYNSAPGCVDDLKEISGVGPALERTLNQQGIYRFQQVADWNDYNVWYFNKIISFPGRIQRDEWISQAKTLAPDSKCLAANREAEEAEARAAAEKAEAEAREAAEKAEAEAREAAEKAEAEAREAAEKAEAEARAKAEAEAAAAAEKAEAEARAKAEAAAAEEESTSKLGIASAGVAAAGLAGAAALGASGDDEVEEEPEPDRPADVSGYSSYLGQYDGEDVEARVQPGVIFTSRPGCVDDLKQISGVGPALEKTLNENGVYRFQQVADWNEYNVWFFNKIMSFPGRIQRDEWISQAKDLSPKSKCLGGNQSIDGTTGGTGAADSGGAGLAGLSALSADQAADYEGEDVGYDSKAGVLYKSRPSTVDDLTEISGVGNVLEGRLNEFGVYRFKQVANWDQSNVDEFGERLEFPGRIEREEWIPQAKRLSSQSDLEAEPEPDRPADVSGYSGYLAQYEGQPVEARVQPGVVFTSKPSCVDDLKDIKGVGKVLEGTLNENGVYRFQQIADWNEYNVWFFNDIMSFPGRIQRDEWISQADVLAGDSKCLAEGLEEEPEPDRPTDVSGYSGYLAQYEGESVEAKAESGVVFTAYPSCADDLKKIKGVGPVLERKMNENGVYRFQQVADWNEYNVWFFNKIMSFPGRIQRDEWISQAKGLAPQSKCTGGSGDAGAAGGAGGGTGDHFSHVTSKGSTFYLYSRQQKLKNSEKSVTLYYFSKDPDHPKGEKVFGLPEGRKVAETATGMLVLKKDK